MGIVQVHPRPESYCVEWTALKLDISDGIASVKKLLKGSPWRVHVVVSDGGVLYVDPYLLITNDAEQIVVHHGDWIVRSPHGKFWYMEEDEFLEQFTYVPES